MKLENLNLNITARGASVQAVVMAMAPLAMMTKTTLLCLVTTFVHVDSSRFAINGPVVTLTLKDPESPSGKLHRRSGGFPRSPWLDIGTLNPSIVTSIQSQEPPLPDILPNLSQVRGTVGYQWSDQSDVRLQPNWIQGEADVQISDGVKLTVQPTAQLRPKEINWLLRLQVKAHDVVAQIARNKLRTLSGTFRMALPYDQVSAISIAPKIQDNVPSCQIEAISGRTKAVASLNVQDPTLQLVHQLDSRHTIAPLVHVLTAKISYQWQALLNGGASVVTTVDPTSHIHVRWTDPSLSGGQWVTDCRLPLEGTTLQALAADIRVRRQFRF